MNDLLAVPQTSERKKKVLYTDGEVARITDLAVQRGVAGAKSLWDAEHPDEHICTSTVQKYKDFFTREKQYFSPQKQGRPLALTPVEMERWVKILDSTRKMNRCITCNYAAAVARGVLRTTRPQLLEQCVLVLGPSWAREQLKAQGFRVRADDVSHCFCRYHRGRG